MDNEIKGEKLDENPTELNAPTSLVAQINLPAGGLNYSAAYFTAMGLTPNILYDRKKKEEEEGPKPLNFFQLLTGIGVPHLPYDEKTAWNDYY